MIVIADMLFSNDSSQQSCLQKLSGAHTSIILVSELCSLQSRIDHLLLLGAVLRDTVICVRENYCYIIKYKFYS